MDLIYIDPPFDVGADFTMQVQLGDEGEAVQKEQSILEAVAYRDRLRAQYEQMAASLTDPLLRQSSISIGISSFDPKNSTGALKSPQELIEAADKNLFDDKESRRK